MVIAFYEGANVMLTLFNSLVHLPLEYHVRFGHSTTKIILKKIERMQYIVTKMKARLYNKL